MISQNDHYFVYWEKTANGAKLLRILGGTPHVSIPSEIAGYPVTELGDYCFAKDSHLPASYQKEEIQLWQKDGSQRQLCGHPASPYGIAELCGDFLESVSLPDTVQKIGNYVFYNCRNLSRIQFGRFLETVGSDAFMNCHKLNQLQIRCGAQEKSGLRKILAQISWDVEVSFAQSAVLFYPEYSETYDEITPAHIFSRNIVGDGFRARQCFVDGAVEYSQYDMVFQKACTTEPEQKLCQWAVARLCHPAVLTEEAKAQYQDYIRAHGNAVCRYLSAKKDLQSFSSLFRYRILSEKDVRCAINIAAKMGWTEGSASMIRWKHSYYNKTGRRYDFKEF